MSQQRREPRPTKPFITEDIDPDRWPRLVWGDGDVEIVPSTKKKSAPDREADPMPWRTACEL